MGSASSQPLASHDQTETKPLTSDVDSTRKDPWGLERHNSSKTQGRRSIDQRQVGECLTRHTENQNPSYLATPHTKRVEGGSHTPRKRKSSQGHVPVETRKTQLGRKSMRNPNHRDGNVTKWLEDMESRAVARPATDEATLTSRDGASTRVSRFADTIPASSHPLDELPTDDECNEFTKDTRQVDIAEDSPISDEELFSSDPGLADTSKFTTSLPVYSASHREKAQITPLKEDFSTGNKLKRKQRSKGRQLAGTLTSSSGLPSATRSLAERYSNNVHNVQLADRDCLQSISPVRAEIERLIETDGPPGHGNRYEGGSGVQLPGQTGSEEGSCEVDQVYKRQRILQTPKGPTSFINEGVDEKPYSSPYAAFDERKTAAKKRRASKHKKAPQQTPATGDWASTPPGAMTLDHSPGNGNSPTASGSQATATVNRTRTPSEILAQGQTQEATHSPRLFGRKEYSMIETYRDTWCLMNDKQPSDFNKVVHMSRRESGLCDKIFSDLCEMFPNHTPVYIARACRRKFHNYDRRGVWTEAEDERLRQAVAEKGTAWKAISEEIGRFWEDCRDRHRNYLFNDTNRLMEKWTEIEVVNLGCAIVDCVQAAKITSQEDPNNLDSGYLRNEVNFDPEHLDMTLVNWQSVSDRMGVIGGGRSRIQCSHKWHRFDERAKQRLLSQAVERRWPEREAAHHTKESGWRIAASKKKMQHMLSGDKVDILEAILACKAPYESLIPWRSLGDPWLQLRWSPREKRAAWLVLKETFQGAPPRDYRATARTLLSSIPQEEHYERWDASAYVAKYDSSNRIANAMQKKRSVVRPMQGGDSADNPVTITESDEEGETAHSAETRPVVDDFQGLSSFGVGSPSTRVGSSTTPTNDNAWLWSGTYGSNEAISPELERRVLALQDFEP